MINRQPLSKGEMEIVRVVWKLKEASVGDVFDAIPAQRDLDYTTLQTYIRRLEAKEVAPGSQEVARVKLTFNFRQGIGCSTYFWCPTP